MSAINRNHCPPSPESAIGIPPDKLERIFDKFVQADTSTTRKYGGTGLGLTITKQLVALMGGRIGVRSQVGVGSTFWFTIPFTVTDQLHEEKRARRERALLGTVPVTGAHVLVAEDHPFNQMFIRKLLQKFGISRFRIVENGTAAIDAYQERVWDVVLMDCHMPEKNGYDATRAIREMEKTSGKHIPIVAMTADAMIGAREKCLRAGMDDYISKPINIDELKQVLGQWILFETLAPAPDSTGAASATAVVDLAPLRTFTDGDPTVEREAIAILITQSDANIEKLRQNCRDGDNDVWVEAAHMMKGGMASIGATALSKLCGDAQLMREASASERSALLASIVRAYERVKEFLRQERLME